MLEKVLHVLQLVIMSFLFTFHNVVNVNFVKVEKQIFAQRSGSHKDKELCVIKLFDLNAKVKKFIIIWVAQRLVNIL